MNIDETIAQAVRENDFVALEKLEQELFESNAVSIAPFAPAIAFRKGVEDRIVEEATEARGVSGRDGIRNFGLALANKIARARRRVAFNLKVMGGFAGIKIVSEGDSWFQYPAILKDIIDHLSEDDDKAILSFGEAGDLLDRMAERQEYLDAIREHDPAIFLLSGGGNDLLGNGRLASILNPYQDGDGVDDVINAPAYQSMMQNVQRDYRRILDGITSVNQHLLVFGHAYDVPPIDEEGPWIGKPLAKLGVPRDLGRQVLARILDDFATFLVALSKQHANFEFVDLRGRVGDSRNSWHDEIHPRSAGFERLAQVMREAIARHQTAGKSGDDRRPISADTFSALSNEFSPADTQLEENSFSERPVTSSFAHRDQMARQILSYEARRDAHGRLKVFYLHPEDGGGRYEVAGINERYHKAEADHLVALIEAGRHEEAENYAVAFIAAYTDPVDRWCSTTPVEFYLRDCMFNRGPGGAAWIVQHAVGVTVDMVVGPITRAAIADAETYPREFLDRLRASRETYERRKRNESSRFWQGLVNRWNNAHSFALNLAERTSIAPDYAQMRPTTTHNKRIMNCLASEDDSEDWGMEEAISAEIIRSARFPDEVDRRAEWWPVGDQGSTGSCVGWAVADSLLRWHFVQSGQLDISTRPSVRFIWMAAKETDIFTARPTSFIEDAGTSLKAALDVARKLGCVTERVLPFERNKVFLGSERAFYARAGQLKIATYHNLRRSPDAWRQWLYQCGPILTRLDVDDTFQNATRTSGRLDRYDTTSAQGGHAIALVGYTPYGFIVRNSWGRTWGDDGFAFASEAYAREAFTETYGVTV